MNVSGKPDQPRRNSKPKLMRKKVRSLLLFLLISLTALSSDTLFFRLSNPWNTIKSPTGQYLRKCVKENEYYHTWDYNSNNILVAESYYSDTNFTQKLLCHKYFSEKTGLQEQTRCYENGRLHGYFVDYKPNGDTSAYQVYDNGALVKEWSSKATSEPTTFTMIEEKAEFPGGRSAWLSYLGENIRYPIALRKEKITGKVVVKVYVEATGEVGNVEIVRGLHPSLDQQVVRVIKKSPKWKPAKQNGKAVRMTFEQPVTF